MKVQFSFAFAVLRSPSFTSLPDAGKEAIRSAVCAAIGAARANDAQSKVKVGLTLKGQSSVKLTDLETSKTTANAPLRLAYLSQELDRLEKLGVGPAEVTLPKSLAEWIAEKESDRVKRIEEAFLAAKAAEEAKAKKEAEEAVTPA